MAGCYMTDMTAGCALEADENLDAHRKLKLCEQILGNRM